MNKIGDKIRCTVSCVGYNDVYVQGAIADVRQNGQFTVTWDIDNVPNHVRENFFPKDMINLGIWSDFQDKINDRIK